MDAKLSARPWHDYFEYGNPHRPLSWECPYHLTPEEKRRISASIQQFQLGESSDGKGLLRRGWAHGRATSDPYFAAALALFIREEQRHSAYLGRFMDREGISCLSGHWIDNVFRRLRSLGGLESCIRTLVTAEVIAVPYYRALRDATESPLLQAICDLILADEAQHLRYQAHNLARLGRQRAAWVARLCDAAQRGFLLTTLTVVCLSHRNVFRAAGLRYSRLCAGALEQWSGIVEEADRLLGRAPAGAGDLAQPVMRPQAPPSASLKRTQRTARPSGAWLG